MSDSIRFYDRALQRLTRRELLNIAWKLGLAAVAQPLRVDAARSRSRSSGRFRSRSASRRANRWPDGVVLWTRLAPEPLAGGGMPMANVEVAWEVATDRAFAAIVDERARPWRGPSSGTACTSRSAGSSPGREYFYRFRVGREVSQTGRTKTAPALGAAVDRLRFAVCGCSHYETGYFTAFRRHRRRGVRLRLPHRRLHLRGPRRWRADADASCASIRATRSTRSSTIATATRSTRWIPISGPRTPRRRSS